MPSILDFLAPYISMTGQDPSILSPGQPTSRSYDMMDRVLPGDFYMPEIRTETPDAALANGSGRALPPPQAQPSQPGIDPSTGRMRDPASGWKQYLPGIIGLAGSALAGGLSGNGLAAASGFAGNYAQAKHQDIQRRRAEQFETEKAIGDTAHKMWQELQGADLSKLPPNLSHLAQQKAAFDQRYAEAIAKDGISPKEAQELISLGTVIKSALPEVQQFAQHAKQAEPYTAGISAGTFEPPPGAEAIAEQGLPDDQQSQLAGIEAFQGAELARQQYDTPAFDPRVGRLISPRESVTLQGQQAATDRMLAQQQMAADRAREAEEGRDRRSENQIAAQDRRSNILEKRFLNMPVPVQTRDEAGNPVVTYVPRKEMMGDNANRSFLKAPTAGATQKAKDAEAALQSIEDLGNLYSPDYVGPIAGRAYRLGEKFPDLGQINERRSAFRAQNATIKNSMIKLITGAQMSQQEAERILQQVPEENNPPKVWKARYDQMVKNARILKDVNAGILDLNEARKQMGLTPSGERPGLTPPPTPQAGATRKYRIISVE